MLSENKSVKGCFFFGTMDSYEDYIEIVFCEQMEIYEVHRSDRMLIIKSYDKVHIGVYASVLWLRMFKPRINAVEINKIYYYAESKEENQLENFIFDSLNPEYFLLGCEDENKICLLNEKGAYSLKYFNRKIVENADMIQGYIALYNYALMLEFISALYNDLICKIDRRIKVNTVIFLYLFGEVSR